MKKFIMTLLLLVSITAAFAINFPSYSGVSRYSGSDYRVQTTPVVHLHSRQAEETDAVKRIGFSSLTTVPQLSEDGYIVSTVDESSSSSGRANRGRTERTPSNPGDNSGTDNGNTNITDQMGYEQPLGSPLIPLLLLAMGYAVVSYYRSRRKAV